MGRNMTPLLDKRAEATLEEAITNRLVTHVEKQMETQVNLLNQFWAKEIEKMKYELLAATTAATVAQPPQPASSTSP